MDIDQLRLGKKEYVHDDRTLMLAKFLKTDIRVPDKFDFDKDRAAFPMRMWGNDEYGDCVIAGRCNHILRLERLEQRHTIALYDSDAITEYKKLTGCQSPGDENDTGLVVLNAMQEWRNQGMDTDGRSGVRSPRNYSIYAYGELHPTDHEQIKTAIYALHGVHFGLWLPYAAQKMFRDGIWDYQGQKDEQWQPGSWGGHLVYSKAYGYDVDGVEIITWGTLLKMSWAFIDKYCDEAWAIVDNNDSWRVKQTVDVAALSQELASITSDING